MNKNKNTVVNYTTEQSIFPVFLSKKLNILDPAVIINDLVEKENLGQYLKKHNYITGRKRYNSIDLLKVVLLGFMESGYVSFRELEDRCKVNIRYIYLMNHETPSYRTFCNFVNDELADSVEHIFYAVLNHIDSVEHIDFSHLYIDGTKLQANANKYTFVWKKTTVKSRYKLFQKISDLICKINEQLNCFGLTIETNTEYVPEYLKQVIDRYASICNIDTSTFVYGKGHRKTTEQRYYEKLVEYHNKLNEYVEKINICSENRNSYSKTDHDSTFMRIKTDYMGNDQLLPAYNIQFGVADEYIAVLDVNQYRSDMDCFIPLMEKFKEHYGFYPKYPVADAGYGSFNNYIYCEKHNMEKYMKFPMYEKQSKDKKYINNPYRAENFKIENGNIYCPNNKKMVFSYRKDVKGNLYGRQEEVYECEDCSNCPYASNCKKTPKNRTIRLNHELTSIHSEVLSNLNCIHGALLRMNRSIQSEGTFGIMKRNRGYDRFRRKGLKSVLLEIYLVSIGQNLYKFQNKLKNSQLEVA